MVPFLSSCFVDAFICVLCTLRGMCIISSLFTSWTDFLEHNDLVTLASCSPHVLSIENCAIERRES